MTTTNRRHANQSARRRTREALAMLANAYGCAGSDEARHLRLIVRRAQDFARRWAEWASTAEARPDLDTVEAASRLLDALGVEIREER